MALAATHVLVTIVILDIFRHYFFGLKKFPRYLLIIGGIAGLAPDLDLPAGWFASWITGNHVYFHGLFTHTVLWPLVFLIVGGILHYRKNLQWAKIFYVISFGWFIHLPLDCIHTGYSDFVWPLAINTKSWCPQFDMSIYKNGIDAVILIIWLIHEEVHKKIRDYI